MSGEAPVSEMNVCPADRADLPAIRVLLRAYAASLAFPLTFQSFERELAELPGAYAPPAGALLIACVSGVAAGCVALRPLEDGACELKRLYVDPANRGLGLGRLLAAAILDEARNAGYGRVRLDTVPGMEAAQALYEQLGFREIAPYTTNPVERARFLEREL